MHPLIPPCVPAAPLRPEWWRGQETTWHLNQKYLAKQLLAVSRPKAPSRGDTSSVQLVLYRQHYFHKRLYGHRYCHWPSFHLDVVFLHESGAGAARFVQVLEGNQDLLHQAPTIQTSFPGWLGGSRQTVKSRHFVSTVPICMVTL